MRKLCIKALASFLAILLLLSLISCSDNPSILPPQQPFLNTHPYGEPHYLGRDEKPVYPDKTIYYPDGTAYKPKCHFYYWYHPKEKTEYGCNDD